MNRRLKILNSKIIFYIFFVFLTFNLALSEGPSFLEIDYLGEKIKILTILREIDSEIYLPLPLFASAFKFEYKLLESKVVLYKSRKEIFINNIGEKRASLEGKTVNLFKPILKEGDIIYFPLSSFFRLLGYRVYLKDSILYIVNEVSNIEYSKGILKISFKGNSLVNFNTFTLTSPSRFVVDLLNVVYINNKGEIRVEDSLIRNIRFSQFSVAPYMVRVVIEYKKDIVNPIITKDLGNIVLKFPTKVSENNDVTVKLVDISWEETSEFLNFFLRFSSDKFTYTKKQLLDPPRYYYDFLDTDLSLTYNEISFQKEPVKSIRIGKREEGNRTVRVVFETYTEGIILSEESYSNTLKISFNINKKKEENLQQYLIFIDPGHGGSDPGAIFGEFKEKDLNLKVALLLADKLKNLGYKVLLTRDNDTTLSLDDRVRFVNSYLNSNNEILKNSLLISIHTNAAFSSDVR
ncbi:MAG: N-acetylmuramoyl-L-alanine amidase, partial [Dictyoglomus sp.]